MSRSTEDSRFATPVTESSCSFVRLDELSPRDRSDWAELTALRPQSAPFLDETWVRAWIAAFAPGEHLVLCLRRAARVAGLAFMVPVRERWGGKTYEILQSATNDWTYRYEFLASNDAGHAQRELWTSLFSQSRWDVIRLDWVVGGAPTLEWGLRTAEARGWSAAVVEAQPSPWRRLPAKVEDWDEGLKSKFKSNLRNRERRIETLGAVSFTVAREGDELEPALRDFYRVEAASWKGREGTAVAMQEGARALFDGLLRGEPDVWIPVLSVGDRAVAAQVLRVRGRAMFLLKTAYDPAFSAYSPGQLVTARTIRYGIERGMQELDFLGVPMDWKSDWMPEARPNYRLVFCSPSPAGRYAYWAGFGVKGAIKKIPFAVPLARRFRKPKV